MLYGRTKRRISTITDDDEGPVAITGRPGPLQRVLCAGKIGRIGITRSRGNMCGTTGPYGSRAVTLSRVLPVGQGRRGQERVVELPRTRRMAEGRAGITPKHVARRNNLDHPDAETGSGEGPLTRDVEAERNERRACVGVAAYQGRAGFATARPRPRSRWSSSFLKGGEQLRGFVTQTKIPPGRRSSAATRGNSGDGRADAVGQGNQAFVNAASFGLAKRGVHATTSVVDARGTSSETMPDLSRGGTSAQPPKGSVA